MEEEMSKKDDSRRLTLDECHIEIWKIRKEMDSYGSILQLASGTLSGKKLYGVGITLKKISKRLNKINNLISNAY